MPQRAGEPDAEDGVAAEARAWLVRLRSAAGKGDQAAFEAWYVADPAHADAYDQLLDDWDDAALIADTATGRSRRLRHAPPSARSRLWYALAAAAAVVLLALVGWVMHQNGVSGADRASPTELATRVGEIHTVTLSDGSRVTLDTDSLVHVAYAAGERRLLLERGRARFDVARDVHRPFVVSADGTAVIAHGTIFDVAMRDGRVAVALLRGAIEVRANAGDATARPGASRRLAAGQALTVTGHHSLPMPERLPDADTRWPSGMLFFTDAPLAAVVAAANRYSDTKIVLDSAAVQKLRFTGTFRAADPGKLVDMLTASFGLTLSRDPSGRYLLAAATRSQPSETM